uniref:Putative serine_threonine protein kinase n=1 Tax=Moumouvirus sp. 'Monve' TaxID=1128131 RepID=H2EFB0_9VIRU|nr:putative serine_threonine protein kinase [Moumouvirus Monve]
MENENIVKIHGYYYDNSGFYIGMELMSGSLMDKLENNKLSDSIKFNYISQLLNGLKYMHEKKLSIVIYLVIIFLFLAMTY